MYFDFSFLFISVFKTSLERMVLNISCSVKLHNLGKVRRIIPKLLKFKEASHVFHKPLVPKRIATETEHELPANGEG
jgi:hypothetical protein